jgi:hypothetical protein
VTYILEVEEEKKIQIIVEPQWDTPDQVALYYIPIPPSAKLGALSLTWLLAGLRLKEVSLQ